MKTFLIFLIFLTLLIIQAHAGKPIKRENGVWFPGKNCGVKNEIKYLYETPEDTSDLECTFIWSQKAVKITYEKCYKFGNPTLKEQFKHPGVKSKEDCMDLCLANNKCYGIEYWATFSNGNPALDCFLSFEDLANLEIKANNILVYASKACFLKPYTLPIV